MFSIFKKKSSPPDQIRQLEEKLQAQPWSDEQTFELVTAIASLYEQETGEENRQRANHFHFLSAQCLIRLGRPARALLYIEVLKERPEARSQVQLLKRWLADEYAASTKPEANRKSDDHLPPPTPYQEMRAIVSFDETSGMPETLGRSQWQTSQSSKGNLFSQLTPKELEQLVDLAELRVVKPNSTLFKEGDEPKAFYIVAEGEMDLESSGGIRRVFREGQFFGEIALFSKMKRTATLSSRSGAKLMEFSDAALENCFFLIPSLREKVLSYYQYRLFFEAASRSVVFKEFSQSELEEWTEYLTPIHVGASKRLMVEGAPSESFYLIARGRVQVTQGDRKVCVLSSGHFVGEIGLILDRPRTATAETTSECLLLECQREDFDDLLRDFPKFKKLVEEVARMRYPDTIDEITHEHPTFVD